jgi:hypothetical protein
MREILSPEARKTVDHNAAQAPTLSLPIPREPQLSAEQKATPIRHDYIARLEMFFSKLIDAAHNAETSDESTFRRWRWTLLPLLASMPRNLLQATLDGSLLHNISSQDPELSPYYQEPENLADSQDVHPWVAAYNDKTMSSDMHEMAHDQPRRIAHTTTCQANYRWATSICLRPPGIVRPGPQG